MEYTAFKAGDKVRWDWIKAVVVEDSPSDNPRVMVRIEDEWNELWYKVFHPDKEIPPISVVLDA